MSTPRLAVDFPCFAIGLSRAFEKCAAFVPPAAAVTGTDWACAVATAKKPIAAAARTVTNALCIEVSRSSGCAAMYNPTRVKTSPELAVPDQMKAWVLGGPDELLLRDKPTPVPGRAEVLVRIDAVAICATDLEIIHVGSPARIRGGLPFNKNFTPGHEYMGTVAALGPDVDEYSIGQRVTVEIHAGCGQCKRCREGMYTACHNYGLNYGDVDKGHRANGFTTDGGFCEYQVNNINTLVAIPSGMSDEEATLVVTAGTAMYGLTELGGLVAGESVVVTGPGPIGLLGVAVAKAM